MCLGEHIPQRCYGAVYIGCWDGVTGTERLVFPRWEQGGPPGKRDISSEGTESHLSMRKIALAVIIEDIIQARAEGEDQEGAVVTIPASETRAGGARQGLEWERSQARSSGSSGGSADPELSSDGKDLPSSLCTGDSLLKKCLQKGAELTSYIFFLY